MARGLTGPHRSVRSRAGAVGWLVVLVTGYLMLAASAVLAQPDSPGQRPSVMVTEVRGIITPVISEHLADAVRDAAAGGHDALVVLLDTPGGLVVSMQEIVQTFLESADLPVIVYVSPRGADAASAGTFITMAAHIAAMAPATTIGAATPVGPEGAEVGEKILANMAARAEAIAEARGRDVEFAIAAVREGRAVTSTVALEVGAIDLIADSLEVLLEEIDGWVVALDTVRDVTLRTAGATLVEYEMSGTRRILQRLADPNLAFLFISIGTLGIIYELANPGVGLGGIIGAIMLILAFFSLSVLPVNFAGVALLILALVLFIGELFVPGVGVMAAGGTISLVIGGLFLFQRPTGVGIDLSVLLPTAIIMAVIAVLLARMVARLHRTRSTSGSGMYIGKRVRVERATGGTGRTQIFGTWWDLRAADADLDLQPGMDVTVVDMDGLTLVVEPTVDTAAPTVEESQSADAGRDEQGRGGVTAPTGDTKETP